MPEFDVTLFAWREEYTTTRVEADDLDAAVGVAYYRHQDGELEAWEAGKSSGISAYSLRNLEDRTETLLVQWVVVGVYFDNQQTFVEEILATDAEAARLKVLQDAAEHSPGGDLHIVAVFEDGGGRFESWDYAENLAEVVNE